MFLPANGVEVFGRRVSTSSSIFGRQYLLRPNQSITSW